MQINQYPGIGSSSLSSLIASTLARRQSSALSSSGAYSSSISSYTPTYSGGSGINYQSSAAIADITAKIDSLNSQVNEIKSKLVVSNSIKNSYSSTITSLNDFLESIKQDESKNLAGITNSNQDVTNIDLINSSSKSQTINLNVKQVATATIVRSDILSGDNVDENTKITDLFAGKLEGYSLSSQRKDLNETKTMKELGIKTGSFTIGNKEISVSESETLGAVMQKIKDAGYDAEITADGALKITGTADKQISFSNQGTNFASALGLTISEGDFSINGKSFSITSETTIKSLMSEINSSRDAGVGAMLQNGKLTLVSNLTGAVLIDIKKGSSNFTNAIGFTSGGEMIADNVVMGADGTATTLKGINSVSTDYSDFTEGTFILSAGRNGNMVSEIINITSGDTVQDVIDKIAASGLDVTASVDKNGNFVLEQKNKGSDYQISVEAGSSNFTEKMGLTNGVENIGITNSGQNTGYYSTITGANKVTLDTEVSAGSFKVNDTTIEISAGTIETALAEINAALADKDVTAVFEDEKIVFKNKIMGNISLSVEGGTSNFGEITGLTEASEGVSSVVIGQVGGKSTLTGSEDVSADTMITDGTVKINGFLIDLSAGTLESVVESLNEHTADTKVTASIVDNRLVLTASENGANSISVEAGISNFVQVTGIAGYQTTAGTEEKFGSSKSAMTMANEVTYDTQILESSVNINGTEITVSGTIANAIAAINAQTATTGVEAFLNTSNHLVLRNVNAGSSTLGFSTSSDFGRVVGAGTYVVTGGSNTKLDQTNATVTGSVTGLSDGKNGTNNTQIIQGSILTIGTTAIELGTSIASAIRAINDKTAVTGVEASLDDSGRFVLKAVNTSISTISFSLSGTGDFGRVTGLGSYTIGASDSGTGVVGARQTTLTGSCDVTGDMKISNSTISILAHNQVQTFELSGTLDDVIKTLSESEWVGHNGITASIENGKFVIRLNDEGAKELTVNVISGDFGRVTGMADYLMGGATITPGTTTVVGGADGGAATPGETNGAVTEITTSGQGTAIVTGGNDVSGSDYVINGTIKIGAYTFQTKNTTLQEVINQINGANIKGVSAYIENDKFVIKSIDAGNVISATGDFARITGIASYSVGASVMTGSAGDIGTDIAGIEAVGMESVEPISKADALSKGYIVIESAADLINAIAVDGAQTAGKTFILMNNIDMSTINNYVSKSNFAGIFDGNGYTISNLSAENGIFASTTETSTIKNVSISGFNIVSVVDNVGALAGINNGLIENSSIDSNSLVSGNSYVGGLVGGGNGKLENLTSYAEVRANGGYAGGIAGSSGDIVNSNAFGKIVAAGNNVGGIAGYVTGNIDNSFAEVSVSGADNTGGLAGSVSGKISLSYSKGDVTGNSYVGGLVGTISSSIKDSYSWSNVNAANYAGGLVGQTTGNVINSYTKGNITASGIDIGGLIGAINADITIDKTYAEGTVQGASNVGGLIGATIDKKIFTLTNSYAKGNVTSTQGGTSGGLIGFSNGGSIMNTYAAGNVTVSGVSDSNDRIASAGGLIGQGIDTNITRSFASGVIRNVGASRNNDEIISFAGGLIGVGNGLKIDTSYSTGSVTLSLADNNFSSRAQNISAGGLIGKLGGVSTVNKSWASGAVTLAGEEKERLLMSRLYNYAGGLIGSVDLSAGAVTVSNTYATGMSKITSADAFSSSYMGGLIGGSISGDSSTNYLTISNSYSAGKAVDDTEKTESYDSKIGGLFGYSETADTVLIENSFFDTEKSGISNGTGSALGCFVGAVTTSQINEKVNALKNSINESTQANSYSPSTTSPVRDYDKFDIAVNRISKEEAEAKGYIVIESAQDFIDKIVNNYNSTKGKTYILTADLDFTGLTGYSKSNFWGTFDGNGYSIKGLTDSLFRTTYGGSTVDHAEIKNVALIDVDINRSSGNTGALIGQAGNYTSVSNVYVTGSVKGGNNTGAIVGTTGSYVTMTNSHSTADVSAYNNGSYNYIGGLVGYLNSYGNVSYSYATGTVSGNNQVGGLFGAVLAGTNINNVFTTGTVTGKSYAGGLIGDMLNGSVTVSDSYSLASVNISQTNGVGGGLIGRSTGNSNRILNSYALGKVSSVQYSGGIIGQTNGAVVDAAGSWWDSGITGQTVGTSSGSTITNYLTNANTHKYVNDFIFTSQSDTSYVHTDILKNKIFTQEEAASAGFVVINTAEDFKNFLSMSGADTSGKTFILMNDINLSGVTLSSMSDFAGTFYGNGHTISNFTSTKAMFDSVTSTGSIRNLKINNAEVVGSGDSAILVTNLNGGVIDNVHVTGDVATSSTGKYVGGLVAKGNGHIDNSGFNGVVTGKDSATGGLIGHVDNYGITITNSYTTGSVLAATGSAVGGLIGDSEYIVKVENSLSSSSVAGDKAGGIIGDGRSAITIINNTYYKKQSATLANGSSDEMRYLKDTSVYNGITTSESGTSSTFVAFGWDSTIWSYTGNGPRIIDTNGMNQFNITTAGTAQVSDTIGVETIDRMSKADAIAAGYIVIESASDFIDLIAQDGVDTLGKTYILMSDIDMSAVSNYVSKSNFAGTFDGNGYSIKNMSAQNGLFATATDTSVIKNVKIVNANIGSSIDNVGALAGSSTGVIENSSIDADSLVGGNSYVGGLVGGGSATIKNSSSDAEVRANISYGGGLAGSAGDISNSVAAGSAFSFGNYVGGLAAQVTGNITNSNVIADVSGMSYAGGLAAVITGDIVNSNVSGAVTGTDYTGGLAGKITGDIEDSFSKIVLTGASYTGGLAGEIAGDISDSYSQGTLNATGINVGGLVGRLNSSNQMTIESSYSEMTVTGYNAVGGLIGGTVTGSTTDTLTSFTVINSYATGNVEARGGGTAGGLIGYAYGGTVLNSYAKGSVLVSGQNSNGFNYQYAAGSTNSNGGYVNSAGGLIGLGMNGAVRNSFATGNVVNKGYSISGTKTTSKTGGLMGSGNYNIFNSYASGNVTYSSTMASVYNTNENNSVGGLVGKYYGGTIEQAWSTGSVIASNYQKSATISTNNRIGGLVGEVSTGSGVNTVIKDTYSQSSVTMQQYSYQGETDLGGLVGFSSGSGSTLTIQNSYASAAIKDTAENYTRYATKAGGLIGYSDTANSIKIENTFFNYQTAGIDNAFGSSNNGSVYALDSELIGNKISSLKDTISAGAEVEKKPATSESEFITEVNRISEEEAIARGYVVIKTAEDFMNAIAENGNGTAGKVYILMNDIDMSSVTGYKGRNNFAGIFDGNGYKIKNLSITTSQSGYVGVFEQIRNGAVVKNVGVENININVSSQRVGALVGYMQNGSAVINSYSTGTVAAGQTRGGLVGHADGKTTIKDSHSSVNVLGYNNGTYNYAGGLVGYVNGNSSNRAVIENSYANGTVAGYAYIGGLVGYANYTDISNSYSSGVVTYVSESNKNGEYRAGLVGHLNSQNVVTDSYSTATVNGANYAGGLFGLMGSTNKVFDSYYSGTLNSIGSYVGGIAGQMNSNNTIYNVKISGTINTTGNYASNIVGNLSGNNSVFNSEFKATLGGNNKFGLVGYRYSGTLTVNGVWFDANAAGTTNAGNSISGSYSSESDYSVIYDAKIAENQRITEEEATQSGYVLIKTSEDLKNFLATDSADTEGKTYVLMRDIDLNGVSGLVAMSDFKGTLYGNGYTIKNFSSQNGFFNSIASGGSVRNLNFYNSNVAATTHAGTVANYLNGGVIDHVTVTNGAVSVADVSGQSLGGLVGYGTGTISYSGFNGTVSGKNASYGGLVGYVSDKGAMSILNSYASGSVSGTDGSNVGGLVGLSNASAGWLNIQDSYADMTVNGTTKGGLVGNATEANTRILDSAYRNSGNISILGNVDDIAYFMDGSITNTISSSQLLNGSLFTNNGWSSEVWEFNGNPPTLASSSLLDDFSLVEVNTDAATIKGSVTVENGGKDNLAFKGQKDGVMTIDISGVGKINIEIAEGDSLQDVLDKISYANGKLSARIDDDGKIVISYNGTTSSMLIEDTSGFAAFYGLKARSTTWNPTVTVENYSNQKITGGNSVLGTDRIVNGSITIAGQTFTAGSKTLSDVVNEINSAGIKGVAASITDGKFTITSEYGAIDFSASGDFARVTGLASYTVGSVTTEKVTDGTTQSSFGVAGTTEVQKISKADALEAGYIVIESVQDFLNAISSNGANTAGKTFILMADIDLSSQSTYTNKSNFAGTLDGNGYSIKNLTSQNGIFTSTTNTAVIKNLTLENINVSSTADNVGALVGNNAGTISNVEVDSATRVNGKNQVGGIVGYTTGKIEKSESHAEVTGTGSYTGGLAGRTLSDISDSIATGSVTNLTTNNYVGGLVGHVQNGSIVNSNASGTVNSKGSYVGGLAGYTSGSVTGAFASGEIHGLHYVGGLIGQTTNSVVSSVGTGDVFASNYAGGLIGDTTGTITASFATGDVEAANYVGGLVGQTTKDIKESYAKGNVTASASYAGGLLGYLKSGGATFDNNFAIGNVTGGIGVGGLIGATTETLISYTLKNSYASGDVNSTGGGTAGGLIGFTNGGTIENVKATGDVTVSGQNGDTSVSVSMVPSPPLMPKEMLLTIL